MFGQVEPVALVTVIVAVVACLATGYAYFRSSAVKVWEQNSDAYRARVELLEEQNKALETKLRWMEQRIHELEARPDWQQVVAVIGLTEKNIVRAVEQMRDEARTQHGVALTEIAAQTAERVRIQVQEAGRGA